ncbi:matrixin family metalloprotease [Chloroflexi bacterium TSY]|nr:matrixin family metalloprotease [Chloroflexi bacterium TSY]
MISYTQGRYFIYLLALLFVVLLTNATAGCTVHVQTDDESAVPLQLNLVDAPTSLSERTSAQQDSQQRFELITVPISVYILDDKADALSSKRTVGDIETIFADVNQIWAQANIHIDVQVIERIEVPIAVIQEIAAGRLRLFFQTAGTSFSIPKPSLLNAFYAQAIGGPNGIAPSGTHTFFVADEPSVHDERVTSHEIGHLLGLHHTLDDTDRLMYPGTNGMNLTPEEIVVARYIAQGLLDRQR